MRGEREEMKISLEVVTNIGNEFKVLWMVRVEFDE